MLVMSRSTNKRMDAAAAATAAATGVRNTAPAAVLAGRQQHAANSTASTAANTAKADGTKRCTHIVNICESLIQHNRHNNILALIMLQQMFLQFL
jgi:hypothetical protein